MGTDVSKYWVQTESRIPLKLVLGTVRILAFSISSREKFFLILYSLSISEGSVVPYYLEVATAVVVPRGVSRTSPRTSI